MAKTVVQIEFKTAVEIAGASLACEVLAEDNAGRTQIPYGQAAYFRVYKFPSDMALTVTPSDGAVARVSSGVAMVADEFLEFVDAAEANARYPVKALSSQAWLGNDLGQLAAPGGSRVVAPAAGVAVARISYSADYELWSLILPPRAGAVWRVLVHARGAVPQAPEEW